MPCHLGKQTYFTGRVLSKVLGFRGFYPRPYPNCISTMYNICFIEYAVVGRIGSLCSCIAIHWFMEKEKCQLLPQSVRTQERGELERMMKMTMMIWTNKLFILNCISDNVHLNYNNVLLYGKG